MFIFDIVKDNIEIIIQIWYELYSSLKSYTNIFIFIKVVYIPSIRFVLELKLSLSELRGNSILWGMEIFFIY